MAEVSGEVLFVKERVRSFQLFFCFVSGIPMHKEEGGRGEVCEVYGR